MKRQIMINLDDAIASITQSIEAQLGSCKMTIVNIAHNDIRLLEGNERSKFIDNVARNILGGMQDNTDHVDDAIAVLDAIETCSDVSTHEAISSALALLRGDESKTPQPHVAAFRCDQCGGTGQGPGFVNSAMAVCITCNGTGVVDLHTSKES